MDTTLNHNPYKPMLLLILIAAILMSGAALALLSNSALPEASPLVMYQHELPRIIVGHHAQKKHPEAERVRKCFEEQGPWQVWYDPGAKNFHLLCNDNGLIHDWIIVKSGQYWEEMNAFIPKDGSWNAVRAWLQRKGATLWTKPLP